MGHPTAVAIEDPDGCPPSFIDFDHGITAIDTGCERPLFAASYLLVEGDRAAFVDTGTHFSVPRLLAVLDLKGLAREDVDYVILTHAHLDHAGGAGEFMRRLPNARLIAHARAARHMIDPSALMAGVIDVYGAEAVRRTYGELVPVAAGRTVAVEDGEVMRLGRRPLRFLDTPGHARHHLCLYDERSRSFFTGDTFGISYREFDTEKGAFIFPSTTPVQFEPLALHNSIHRLMAFEPQAMFLTHYGRVHEVPRLAAELHIQIDRLVALAQACNGFPDRHQRLAKAIEAFFLEHLADHGCRLPPDTCRELLAPDVELNAQGLEVWLDRGARR